MKPSRAARHDHRLAQEVTALLLRAAVGGTMVAHGVKHARSLDGTARWFSSIGFRRAPVQATASAIVEIGSGSRLLVGAATPLSAATVVGTMTVAARSVHVRNGFLITAEWWEYVANLASAAIALAAIGPGRLSVDRAAGLDRWFSGHRAAAAAVVGGLVAAAAQLATFWQAPER